MGDTQQGFSGLPGRRLRYVRLNSCSDLAGVEGESSLLPDPHRRPRCTRRPHSQHKAQTNTSSRLGVSNQIFYYQL